MTTSTDLKTFKIAKGTKAQIITAYNNGDIGDTDFAIATDESYATSSDLTTKADVDLSNLNATGKSLASGLGLPSSRYTTLTIGASDTSYTAPAIYFNHYNTFIEGLLPKWLFTIIATILLIIAETKGHFPGFLCGTESLEYIEEQLAKGRKIPYHKLISWFGKIRGFEEFGREWCFWQLILCKTVWLIPVSLMLGSQFIFIGLCVAFVYNACFWVELKPFKKLMVTPTNWGEFFQGCLYFQGLL